MKSYKDITNKYLRQNLKRTILTVCGIILSVALITSIGLFIKGIQNMLVVQEIQKKGAYFVEVPGTSDAYKKILGNSKVDKIGLVEYSEKISLKDKKSIQIIKMDKNAFSLLPCRALEGRLPQREGEIALEKWILNYFENVPKLGDNIQLKQKDGTIKEFILTGFIEDKGQSDGVSSGITYSEKPDPEKSTIYLTISNKTDISRAVKEFAKTFDGVNTNSYLLDYMGEGEDNSLNSRLYLIAAIIILVAVLATLAVIYNSFQISVVERIKQFGLLKAVGTTPKQIRRIVLREASILSLFGIPLGLLSGIFALWVITKVFRMMSYSIFRDIQLVVPWYVMVLSAAVGIITIYISAFIPARFAGRISPLTAISSRTSIVKEKVNKKRGRLLKGIFSINTIMAFKNIKRNRKRFRITVFSISISVMLFIFFSSFIGMSETFTTGGSESTKAHFLIYGNMEGKSTLTQEIIDKIKGNPLVMDVYPSYGNHITKAVISKEQIDEDAQGVAPDIYEKTDYNGKEQAMVKVIYNVYDRNMIQLSAKYLTGGAIDYDTMVKENGVILIKNNTISRGSGKRYSGPITKLKLYDIVPVNKNSIWQDSYGFKYDDISKINFKDKTSIAMLKISAVADDPPFDFYTDPAFLRIIVPLDVFKNISNAELSYTTAEIVLKDENTDEEFEKWLQTIADNSNNSISNIASQKRQSRTNSLQMKILMYGFIVVISLIGAVNIINTVTTNLILRRREIASLSALGMTYKNIRSMIVTEGLLYSVYGCFYGMLAGSILTYLNYMPMRDIMNFKWHLPFERMLVAAGAAVFISLIAVIKPLNRIKKENIIEVIRAEE